MDLFFEDCYRRINVREYARIKKISPPTASKLLQSYQQEGLLLKEEEKDKNYHYYSANRSNNIFIDLSRIYWYLKLESTGIINFLEKELLKPKIILFGSMAKAEVHPNSDLDLAIFTISKKKINLAEFEKKLKREIQLFIFPKRDNVKNKELLNNILNGYCLRGNW